MFEGWVMTISISCINWKHSGSLRIIVRIQFVEWPPIYIYSGIVKFRTVCMSLWSCAYSLINCVDLKRALNTLTYINLWFIPEGASNCRRLSSVKKRYNLYVFRFQFHMKLSQKCLWLFMNFITLWLARISSMNVEHW